MVYHQGREHDIKRVIGEGKPLDYPDLEVNEEVGSGGAGASTSDLLRPRVNPVHTACCANPQAGDHRQRSGAAPHIQHRLSWLKLSQFGGPKPQLPQLATQYEGIEEPHQQVITPAQIHDPPSRRGGHRLACFSLVVMRERMHRSCSLKRKSSQIWPKWKEEKGSVLLPARLSSNEKAQVRPTALGA